MHVEFDRWASVDSPHSAPQTCNTPKTPRTLKTPGRLAIKKVILCVIVIVIIIVIVTTTNIVIPIPIPIASMKIIHVEN